MSSCETNLQRAKTEAREWVASLNAGGVDENMRLQFRAWLAADPVHASEFVNAEQIWRDLAMIDADQWEAIAAGNLSVAERVLQATRDIFAAIVRPQVVVAVGMAIAIAVVSFRLLSPAQQQHYTTSIAENRAFSLEDGSIITLGGSSEAIVAFSANARQVTLTNGEAFFEVAKNTNRPFFVKAGNTRVRVTGTQFDVLKNPRSVYVAVAEGEVDVSRATEPSANSSQGAAHRLLTAGTQVIASHDGALGELELIPGNIPGAWRHGRLTYDNVPLERIVGDVNRYYRPGIELQDDAKLGKIRLTTSFGFDQIEQMISVLQASQPVEVARMSNGRIIVRSRN